MIRFLNYKTIIAAILSLSPTAMSAIIFVLVTSQRFRADYVFVLLARQVLSNETNRKNMENFGLKI